ncbi:MULTISPECIES: hypothetical protein [Enterococcus]|uniref:hypothetical protein n=1 Tax=Enterococcus TaxID=1350 RepID=UPI0010F692B0|nr:MULTISPECIES: hypothetical protein [Enterococcus]MBM7712435.1 hypothetical protein [Enterococcus xiangfangensis]
MNLRNEISSLKKVVANEFLHTNQKEMLISVYLDSLEDWITNPTAQVMPFSKFETAFHQLDQEEKVQVALEYRQTGTVKQIGGFEK